MTFRETYFKRLFTRFTEKNSTPTVNVIYEKLEEISAGTSNKFSYGQTTLYSLLIKLGFEYQKTDNQKVTMEIHDTMIQHQ